MKLIQTLLISVILIGCTTTTTVVEVDKPLVAHPSLPTPVKPRVVNMKAMNYEGVPLVIMSVKDSQNLRVFNEDMLRYIKNINSIVCGYRRELNEDFCKER